MTAQSSKSISRDEFDAFKHYAESQFKGVQTALSTIEHKLDESRKPNYSHFIGIGGVMAVVVGMGGGLVGYALNSNQELAMASDEATNQRIDYLENGNNRWTRSDQEHFVDQFYTWQRRQDDRIDKLSRDSAYIGNQVENNTFMLRDRGKWMQDTAESVHRLDEKSQYHFELDKPERVKE